MESEDAYCWGGGDREQARGGVAPSNREDKLSAH